jgi:hypothetical protein
MDAPTNPADYWHRLRHPHSDRANSPAAQQLPLADPADPTPITTDQPNWKKLTANRDGNQPTQPESE